MTKFKSFVDSEFLNEMYQVKAARPGDLVGNYLYECNKKAERILFLLNIPRIQGELLPDTLDRIIETVNSDVETSDLEI